MSAGLLSSTADIARFMHAGNATLTLKSEKTGVHYTYRVKPNKKQEDRYFVEVLTGPDNGSNYSYLGVDVGGDALIVGARSRFKKFDPPAEAFRFLQRAIKRGEIPETLKVYHAGRCGRCGRKLTHPESIESGFGPECVGLLE